MLFSTLFKTIHSQAALISTVRDLVAQKQSGAELDEGPQIPILQEFVVSELARLEAVVGTQPRVQGEVEPLNELFREYLSIA